MEYAGYAKYGNEPVDGFILQAPVSDRECMDVFFPNAEPSVAMAAKWIAEGKGGDCLPRSMVPAVLAAPISAYRLHSLIAKGYVYTWDSLRKIGKYFWVRHLTAS